ncbi:MAG: hypothetical protein EXR94_01270 [Gemmatimonadetes bacterium]|nr:hypothetical protein [Gemmatimonadota bacterium]
MLTAEPSRRADPIFEIEVRRLTSRLAVGLLRSLGAAHLNRIVTLADHVREQMLSGPRPDNEPALRLEVLRHADQWLAEHGPVRFASPLEATPDDLLEALLWSTHGALPPRVSNAVILRSLLAVPVTESAQILGIPALDVNPLVHRAVRRAKAFGLDVRRPGPQELRRGIMTANLRLRGLANRIARSSVGRAHPLAQLLIEEWVDLVRGGGRSWRISRQCRIASRT